MSGGLVNTPQNCPYQTGFDERLQQLEILNSAVERGKRPGATVLAQGCGALLGHGSSAFIIWHKELCPSVG